MPMESRDLLSLSHLKHVADSLLTASGKIDLERKSNQIADNQTLLKQFSKALKTATSDLKKAVSADERSSQRKAILMEAEAKKKLSASSVGTETRVTKQNLLDKSSSCLFLFRAHRQIQPKTINHCGLPGQGSERGEIVGYQSR